MELDFQHLHAAHCESGVTASLLAFHGLELSEAMVFGIGAGLYFVHLPFVKVYDIPLTNYRSFPGRIISRLAKRLGIDLKFMSFRKPSQAMAALDQALAQGLPVALRTGMYWLPYFPPAFRFHFNAHNIIIYGQRNGNYLVSDPVLDHPAECPAEDLAKARFAQGHMAPRGSMFYPLRVPKTPDFQRAIRQGIREVVRKMTRPFPSFLGVRGLRSMARRIPTWPAKVGPEMARQYLAMVVRMQEEIGTGGGGFRFMYASFLSESADVLGRPDLLVLSQEMTAVGDQLRLFALACARICKKKIEAMDRYQEAANLLTVAADREEKVYQALGRARL